MQTPERIAKMQNRLIAPAIVLAALTFSPLMHAQTAPPAGNAQAPAGGRPAAAKPRVAGKENENIHVDGWNRKQAHLQDTGTKPGPAPMRDISGIWEPIPRYRDGVFASGAPGMPGDAAHEAIMPYTPAGKEAFLSHHPGFGTTAAPVTKINDPFDNCDPIGLPRIDLFNLRGIQIVQTPKQVLILYQQTRMWRNIWTDGRPLLKPDEITEPRWFGYSVGRWVDPYTLVVESNGFEDSTWIDNVGRPHSSDMVVEETYHRVDDLTFEISVKITDPAMYTKPWMPLDKFRMGKNSDDFDIREMICSVSQQALYNELYKATGADGPTDPGDK
jgi:hypothetical protein